MIYINYNYIINNLMNKGSSYKSIYYNISKKFNLTKDERIMLIKKIDIFYSNFEHQIKKKCSYNQYIYINNHKIHYYYFFPKKIQKKLDNCEREILSEFLIF